MSATVTFVGAGPGAADLLTFRAARVIAAADVVVWAGSLVNAEVLAHARPEAAVLDSSGMTLEEVLALFERAHADGRRVARLHSGDPSLYGAIGEQIAHCERRGIPFEIVPGVSSLGAAAAALGIELTVPHVAQSVILTRLGHRSPMPPNERLVELARHGTTIALFLFASRPEQVQAELLAGGYGPDSACAIVVRATWPDERVLRCRLGELATTVRAARVRKTALLLLGPALDAVATRSNLYHPGFSHGFRRRHPTQRRHDDGEAAP